MFSTFWRVHVQFLLLLCLWCGASAYGQILDPTTEDVRLKVTQFSLADPDSRLDWRLSMESLRKQMAIERSRFGDTVSVSELHQAADAMTLYVRNLGFLFHTVYLPPQRVEGGVVEFRLQQGKLVGINVINSTKLKDARFERVFAALVGQVLYAADIEDLVQALKAQGGFTVFPYYSRGTKAGEARLNLKVDPAGNRSFAFRADNYGSPASGEYRVVGQYSEYQLTGHHDRLAISVLQAVDGVANTYGAIQYDLPFAALKYNWDISASNNQFEVGDRFEILGLEGTASTYGTGISALLQHHPKNASRLRFGIYQKTNDVDLNPGRQYEQSRVASLMWSKSLQLAESGVAINLVGELNYGEYDVEGVPDGGKFTRLDLSGFWLKGLSSGRTRNLVQISGRSQLSDGPVPSIEGFVTTGAYGVRGFANGLFTADSAQLVSLEWQWPSLLTFSADQSWRIEPYLMGEWATGSQRDMKLNTRQDASFGSVGAGIRLAIGRHFSGQLIAAKGLDGEINGKAVDGDEQVLFEMRWR